MKANIGLTDRFLRLVLVLFIIIARNNDIVSGAVGGTLVLIACVLVLTVIVGMCPIYTIFGINTNEHKKAH